MDEIGGSVERINYPAIFQRVQELRISGFQGSRRRRRVVFLADKLVVRKLCQQVLANCTLRLKIGLPEELSGSTQKYP